jgi:cysteine-S-conjugate beta-lyase
MSDQGRMRRHDRPLADGRAAVFAVPPPIQRNSTVRFHDLASFEFAAEHRFDVPYYGRYGTVTTFELERLVAQLEEADKTYAVSSGHAGITAALLAFLSTEDHVLIPACAYEPTKHLATRFLRRFGIAATFYPARAGRDIASRFTAQTRVVWIEAPASLTYEIAEIDEIVACAKERGIITIADNTWSSAHLFKPLRRGVDVSIVSGTKYMSGHADAIGGFISTRTEHRPKIEAALVALGPALSPDAAYLIWRGIQDMDMRLRRQADGAHLIATALSSNRRVNRVFYPALPGSPDHERWRKYFGAANGLLSFTIPCGSRAQISAFISALERFRLGVSWGGHESLVFATPFVDGGSEPRDDAGTWLVRVSVGLEDPRDLLADLDQAIEACASAAA